MTTKNNAEVPLQFTQQNIYSMHFYNNFNLDQMHQKFHHHQLLQIHDY